jgi:regulator of replication initiation timing
MRVDEQTVERLVDEVSRFKDIMTNYENHVRETATVNGENKQLREKIANLEKLISSTDYRTRLERGVELDTLQATLKAALKLEYDKGYADAYVTVTGKMKA